MTIISPVSSFNSTIPSTGCCPAGWREFWRAESARLGSDWISIAETISPILHRLAASLAVSS